jgi:hypothetical protein
MLRFYKFSSDAPSLVPAKEVYHRRSPGKGWPEECPPLRAANAFGWDVVSAFDMRFTQREGEWMIETTGVLESDWLYSGPESEGDESAEGTPQTQVNAWFWEKDQVLPHRISPEVYAEISNQVKVSTFLYLMTDPGELIYLTDVPNRSRPWRALSAVLDTDWYPASYPWHCVLELDRDRTEITIEKGEPICRCFLVRRDNYFAQEMSTPEFERYFQRSQQWISQHGRGDRPDMLDITRTYVKQQRLSTFSVIV